jgi:hypothetical protein
MIKKQALVGAIVALGFSASGTAYASAFATSILTIDDFLIKDKDSGAIIQATDFASLVGNNNGALAVSLSGAGPSTSDNDSLANPIDLSRLCVGNCAAAPGENDFVSITTPPPTVTYASADNQLTGSAIDFGLGTTGADANTRADISIASIETFGNSASDLGLTSTFDFQTGATGLSGFTFEFLYDAYLDAYTSLDEVAPANAFSSMSWGLSLRRCNNPQCSGATTTVFSWNPDALNVEVSVDAPINGLVTYSDSGSLSNSTDELEQILSIV